MLKVDNLNKEALEQISALLDEEEPSASAARKWLDADEAAGRRYRQYRRMGEVLRALPEPEITPDFASRVLKRAGTTRLTSAFLRVFAAVAATVVVTAGGWLFYAQRPVTGTASPPVVAVHEDRATIPPPCEIQEEAFGLDMADVSAHCGMTLSMMLIEEMPEELLLGFLAESSMAGQARLNDEEEPSEDPLPEFSGSQAPSFTALLDFVDKMDKAEADALNNALRTALIGA
ncbi:MAG: hypothetical protein KA031_00640 [Candidatus Hydrogenedentes bacterium]|nr:hypothetical protein [Candidatus Hydrogenedentota bacterium]